MVEIHRLYTYLLIDTLRSDLEVLVYSVPKTQWYFSVPPLLRPPAFRSISCAYLMSNISSTVYERRQPYARTQVHPTLSINLPAQPTSNFLFLNQRHFEVRSLFLSRAAYPVDLMPWMNDWLLWGHLRIRRHFVTSALSSVPRWSAALVALF